MSLTKGGWDIITMSQPPFTLQPGTEVAVIVEFYSDDAEPVERKDTALVEVSSVRSNRHVTSFVGRVIGGDIDPLLRHVVTGAVNDARKGMLELAPVPDAAPEVVLVALPLQTVRQVRATTDAWIEREFSSHGLARRVFAEVRSAAVLPSEAP